MRLPQRASTTATPIGFSTVILITLLLFWCGNLQAEIVQYTFTGQIPDGAIDTHSFIDIGEFWEANFLVDLNTPGSGDYFNAVISNSLTFSGGYTSTNDFNDSISVENDLSLSGSPLFDLVQVEFRGTVVGFQTTDLSVLTSTALPGAGTIGAPSVPPTFSPNDLSFAQLFFVDPDGNGTIAYGGATANNVTFSASAVPEPSSFLAVLLMTMSATFRVRFLQPR